MFCIAASRWAPSAREDGSLKEAGSPAAGAAGAGVGVLGALSVLRTACVGAFGAAGVCDGGAGVCGGFEELGGGWAFGCKFISTRNPKETGITMNLRNHAYYEAFLLDIVKADRLCIIKDLSGVNQFLCSDLPPFLFRYCFL